MERAQNAEFEEACTNLRRADHSACCDRRNLGGAGTFEQSWQVGGERAADKPRRGKEEGEDQHRPALKIIATLRVSGFLGSRHWRLGGRPRDEKPVDRHTDE